MQQLYNGYRDDTGYTAAPYFLADLPWFRVPGVASAFFRDFGRHISRGPEETHSVFDDALLKLTELVHVNIFVQIFHTWRGYPIHGREDIVDEYFAAPTALVLRALGWRNSFFHSLKSLRIHFNLSREDFWVPEALESVWYPAGPMDRIPRSRMHLTRMQQNLMEDAFVHLEKLEIRVSAYTKNFSPKSAACASAAYLRKARHLKTLNLGVTSTEEREDYRRHVRGNGTPAKAFIDVLCHITVGVRWPALKDLWLSMAMTTPSLITLFLNVARHLDDLRLTECILIGRGDTWDQTYDFMRSLKMKALQKLRFRQCVDLTPDGLGHHEARNYWCTSAHPFPSNQYSISH